MAIKLELEVEEVNGILNTLSNLSYAQVEPLITKIRGQALPQLQDVPTEVLEPEVVAPKSE
jgi:hypothetical protein